MRSGALTARMVLPVAMCALTALMVVRAQEASQIQHLPLDSADLVIAGPHVVFDPSVSSDGHGSLRIVVAGPTVVPLFEIDGPPIDDATLVYRARVRSQNLRGGAFLEMWCLFPGTGEFFSRGLPPPITGTMDWRTVQTPFFLKPGQRPSRLKLNLVVNGSGTVWIDDIRLMREPLPALLPVGQPLDPPYGWVPGAVFGLVAAVIGALAGWLAPKGRARGFVVGIEVFALCASIAMLVGGLAAFASAWPRTVWFGLLVTGTIGTAVLPPALVLTISMYRRADERRLNGALL